MIEGEALFLDALVTKQMVELKTHLSTYGRGAYWFVPARWAQFEGYEEFFAATIDRLPAHAVELGEMRNANREGVFSLLEAAAVAQYPDLAEHAPAPRESLLGRVSRVARRRRR
jgi:hypothetical protein